ncbi:ATP-binding cassette subfamily C protein CydD [Leucobacter exalbidus]|uniref:ATP-binding cassette subfamily C protein CydD n=1 Tax=Leucobacter exalbidus TaxID=662960 RepID=A0A940PTM0_9MICO|nr:thiol reductant ABC exporter subunit CydD [Leucobacter exalbidus]MBP1325011.1 ATP-binding cassette subfamily C protein CydD [Leucobacter exalbidus]
MKPLDPRLLRYASAARRVLALGGGLGLIRTLATIAWCWFLANALTVIALPVLAGAGGGAGQIAQNAPDQRQLPQLIAYAAAAFIVRALAGWAMDVTAARGAVRAKEQLRSAALNALDRRAMGPAGGDGPGVSAPASAPGTVETSTILGRGLDALDGYFSGYLPQLILAVIATPVLVATILLADPVSGVTVLIVFPVIPMFMVLIGLATKAVQDRQWAQLRRLSGSFLDAVEGLSTLKIFRREHRQAARIAREADDYRVRTMKVLRVTFLSGFVLDLAGTFSIALVAVTVGTRLVEGAFPLALGLFVLLLVPEAFIPVRQVGAAFHASTEGLAASQDVFALIEGGADEVAPGVAADSAGDDTASTLTLEDVTVARGARQVAGPVSLTVAPGEVVALAGPSGAGKSSVLAAVLGFAEVTSGRLSRPGAVSWVGQRPDLARGTVATNVALGDDAPDPVLVVRALHAAQLPDVDPVTPLGALGSGLSGGQAQRVAIARGLYRAWAHDAPIIMLDEPTSALDADTEARICDMLRAEASAGRGVLVVSHRPAVLAAADRVVTLGDPEQRDRHEIASQDTDPAVPTVTQGASS